MSSNEPPPVEGPSIPPQDSVAHVASEPFKSKRELLNERVREHATGWLKETGSGILTSLVLFLFSMVLVQLGLAAQGQELTFELFSPYEFWKSFSGLVVTWSQWNEWLLLGLGLFMLAATIAIWLSWRAARRRSIAGAADAKKSLLRRTEGMLHSVKTVGAVGMISALLLGAYAYQQYLWNIELPVPSGKIGVAFTRQVGSNLASEKLADNLRKSGHESEIVMRDLPVTFDARDTAAAQKMAQRIHAEAVVIYREESPSTPASTAKPRGLSAPRAAGNSAKGAYAAYIVFADPSIGVQIPVPQRDEQGHILSVGFKQKEGLEAPRIEASDVSRLMEAAAGILLYDKDRYLPAIAHLQNASAASEGIPADPLIQYYLGNAYYLINQTAAAGAAYDKAIAAFSAKKDLSVQERLVLANAYSYRAEDLFFKRELDEAERLLKKAVALRAPLDRDEGALSDPVTFRKMHDTFGTTYVNLMALADYRKDSDAKSLWLQRARAESKALLTKRDDPRALTSAIWMSYRTGSCEDAYKMASDILAKDPTNRDAHQLLMKIAALRDSESILGIESKQHLDALLRLDPRSLPLLQTLFSYYGLMFYQRDNAYLHLPNPDTSAIIPPDAKTTVDRILEIDPTNVDALRDYEQDVRLLGGNDLITDASGQLAPVGDPRTFNLQQQAWAGDPARIRAVVAEFKDARSYTIRWSEELEPDSAAPLVDAARLNAQAEWIVYMHLYVSNNASRDAGLVALHNSLREDAIRDASRALDQKKRASPYQQTQAYSVLASVWSHRYFSVYQTDEDAANTARTNFLTNAEEAARLLDENPPKTGSERSAAEDAYMNLLTAARLAYGFYTKQGDKQSAEKYDKISKDALTKMTAAYAADRENINKEAQYFANPACAGSELSSKGLQALRSGKYGEAVQLLSQYQSRFPNDPSALLNLAWAQFKAGDLDASAKSGALLTAAAPDVPYGHTNLGLVHLAREDVQAAHTDYSAAFAALDRLPLGERLSYLSNISSDLLDLARDYTASRPGVKAVVADFRSYLVSLPPSTPENKGAMLIYVENALGGASLWAGDTSAAEALYKSALEINPNYLIARTNLGLTYLVEGDEPRATIEYDKAIAAVPTYLKDSTGAELTDSALKAASSDAANELTSAAGALEIFMKEKPKMHLAGDAILAKLRAGAAALSK